MPSFFVALHAHASESREARERGRDGGAGVASAAFRARVLRRAAPHPRMRRTIYDTLT